MMTTLTVVEKRSWTRNRVARGHSIAEMAAGMTRCFVHWAIYQHITILVLSLAGPNLAISEQKGIKTKFPTISDKISAIDCKTLDPCFKNNSLLFILLFQSGQISNEMAVCGL